jgi:AcrR family transcriptional regulator
VTAAKTKPATEPGRRYGAALESAILDAGWDELVEVGYARLTMASVAARARTSEPVLYRRWPNKDQLVLAVLDRYRTTHPVKAPDTGDLRNDLVQYLTAMSNSYAGFFAIAAAAAFSGLLAATGKSPAQIREQVIGDQLRPQARAIYRRATARGEIDQDRIPTTVLALPFDLVRHDLLMNLKPLTTKRVRSIVDEAFIPLIQTLSR